VAAIVMLRWRTLPPSLTLFVARTSFATLVIYVCAMYGMARMAETAVAARFAPPLQAQANPVPGVPYAHRVILVYENGYRVVRADGSFFDVPRAQPDAVVQAALEAEAIRGFVTWMRYPYWEVEKTESGWTVRFRDLRYKQPNEPAGGVGYAEVFVPKEAVAAPYDD
jgi:inner membrane protein